MWFSHENSVDASLGIRVSVDWHELLLPTERKSHAGLGWAVIRSDECSASFTKQKKLRREDDKGNATSVVEAAVMESRQSTGKTHWMACSSCMKSMGDSSASPGSMLRGATYDSGDNGCPWVQMRNCWEVVVMVMRCRSGGEKQLWLWTNSWCVQKDEDEAKVIIAGQRCSGIRRKYRFPPMPFYI